MLGPWCSPHTPEDHPGILWSACLKVKRAHKHIQEAETWANRFLADHADTCRRYVYSNAAFEFPVHVKYPPYSTGAELGPMVGDACHNLRAALDHAVCEVVTTFGGDASRLYFPINNTRQSSIGTSDYRLIERHSTGVAIAIADQVKPFLEGGEGGFQALNQLDRTDKHRMIVLPHLQRAGGLIFLLSENVVPEPRPGWRVAVSAESSGGGDDNNQFIPLTPGSPADLYNQQYGHTTADIVFGEETFLKDQPVIPTLHQLAQLVTGTLEVIAVALIAEINAAIAGG